MGDMLFISAETPKPKRIQGALVGEKEVNAVADFLKDQGEPEYNEEILKQAVKGNGDLGAPDDDLFLDAADCVIRAGKDPPLYYKEGYESRMPVLQDSWIYSKSVV
jgi:S-DNA-T family DNA segregation ATPase FtsK/SpoIIIE